MFIRCSKYQVTPMFSFCKFVSGAAEFVDLGSDGESSGGVSPARESALLAEPLPVDAAVSRAPEPQNAPQEDFFVDRNMEFAYIDVSTLYYPARPE